MAGQEIWNDGGIETKVVGAALNIVDGKLADTVGGYSYGECKYDIGDVTVRTYVSDHNPILRKFVMPVEVHIGDYTILHPARTPAVVPFWGDRIA